MLVAMKGHPGCGKSSLARGLGKALGWPVLDKDDVRDCTFPLQHLHHVPSPLLNSFSYQVLWRLVDTQLHMGISVIVDCPLSRHSLFLSASSLACRHSARLLIIECVASDSGEWKRRLEGRAAADAVCLDEAHGQHQNTLGMMQDALKAPAEPCEDGEIGSDIDVSSRPVEFTALPHEAGVAFRNQETYMIEDRKGNEVFPHEAGVKFRNQETDMIEDRKGNEVFEGAPYKGWHKPGSWESLQKLIQAYENCWDYDTSASCKKLVVDTTALHHDALVSGVLKWIRAVSDETHAVMYLSA